MQADPGASLSATLTCLHAMRAPDSPPQRLVICEEGGGKGSQAKSLIKTSAGRVAVERLGTCNTTVSARLVFTCKEYLSGALMCGHSAKPLMIGSMRLRPSLRCMKVLLVAHSSHTNADSHR
eukprot:1158384-Pelagomonas_calceolata.AAC.5